MSSNNPYAVNGYGTPTPSNQASSNSYAGSNPYGGANPYADPYLPQSTASSASVNSYGSRGDRDRRRNDAPPAPSIPYGRPPQRRQSPAPPQNLNLYDSSQRSRSPGAGYAPAEQGPRGGGGYGGLGTPNADFDRQRPPSRPTPAAQNGNRERDQERERMQSDSRSRERRTASDAREMPPPASQQERPSMPKPNPSSLRPVANGAHGANRQYPANRPTKSMDEILRHIQNSWRVMEGDECVPVKVALQLADPSSLGLGDREQDFAATHVNLQKSLKAVVNEHYADFNSAVGTYHKIQASIKESQSRVRYLKTGLATVKGGMLTTRPELRDLAEQSGQLDDLLLTVNQMEGLRELPARLEEKINEKKWIGAVDILGEALIRSRKSGLDDIGAMTDLRSYFASQESSLLDMLIEELHDHLYLKSPYCSERWKGRKVNGGEGNARDSFGGNAWDRPVYHFLAALDTKKPMTEDASKNPESDTFYYIQMIVEALNRRGYLEELVTRIEQRLPVELFKVVERTNNEIDTKYPSVLRGQNQRSKRGTFILHASENDATVLSDFLWTLYAKFEAIAEGHRVLHEVVLGIADRENLPKPEQYGASFKELWKLYQMEIRSLLHDYLATDGDLGTSGGKLSVAAGDVFSRQPRDKSKRMFKLAEMDQKSTDIQIEEDALEDILKNSVPGLVTKSKNNAGSNLLLDRGTDATAAGHKLLIEPSVFNMTILLPPSLIFLQHLKDIVPQTSNIPMSTLTSFLDDFLINVFHPQLEEAVADLCTENMVDFDAWMEDPQWARHSPHPIFKGTVGFMSLLQAFSAMLSSIPQDQMFTQLVITQLFRYYDRCYGFYKNIVSRVSQANQSSGIITTVMKAAAGYAEEGNLRETLLSLWNGKDLDRNARKELIKQEVQQLLIASKASPIHAYDIISDPKSVHQLSLVHNSMQWLSAQTAQLRHVEALPSKTHSRNTSLTGQHNPRRWTLIKNLKINGDNNVSPASTTNTVYLPLTSETAVAFDETLSSFRNLATKAILTLHLDIRCGIIHQLGRTFRGPTSPSDPTQTLSSPASAVTSPTLATSQQPQSTMTPTITTANTRESTPPPLDSGLYPFHLPIPPTAASPLILDLNTDLINFEANISSHLGRRERHFILSGLGTLVDRYFVAGADFIGIMNRNGAERMRVNGMVVQQVLRGLGLNSASTSHPNTTDAATAEGAELGLGINDDMKDAEADENDALLTNSAQYYELFLQGPDAVMEYVKENKPRGTVGYTYDELRTLIELCFSSSLRGQDREEAIRARKRMGDVLLQLGEIMWDS